MKISEYIKDYTVGKPITLKNVISEIKEFLIEVVKMNGEGMKEEFGDVFHFLQLWLYWRLSLDDETWEITKNSVKKFMDRKLVWNRIYIFVGLPENISGYAGNYKRIEKVVNHLQKFNIIREKAEEAYERIVVGKFYAGGFLWNPKTKEVLLHHRDSNTKFNPNKWAFFGGLNEPGEAPKQTFARELKEELNVEVSENEIIPLCDYYNEEFGTYRWVFFVESDLPKSRMRLNEGAGFDWIPLGRVFEYDLSEKPGKDLEAFIGLMNKK